MLPGKIHGFVVGNGRQLLGLVDPDHMGAADVELCLVADDALLCDPGNAIVRVDHQQIGIAEVRRIAVDKLVISAGNSKIFDAIAGEDIGLDRKSVV